ncbi:carbohydrate ABC transporter permease [Paenibacillus psychroresistens]|nr:carbohydrate ABC transporter permease [Paenibacillus psychroresistens]
MNTEIRKQSAVTYYLFLILGLLVFMGPLLWLMSTMLKTQAETYAVPTTFIPDEVTFSAFQRLFTQMPEMPRWIANSFMISTTVGVGTVFSSSLVAFGFTRTKARSRNAVFIVLMTTLMIPSQVTLIPLYVLYRNIGWYNTWLPLIMPALLGTAYFIFLFRQFFMTIPIELDEATYMDGGSSWTIYTRVIMPLSGPIITTAFIFSFVASWQDFFTPFLFIQSEKLYPLSVGLQKILGDTSRDYPMLAAGSFIALLPIGIIYFFAQRYFVEGVVLSGIK